MDASLHSEFGLFFLDLSTEERERIMAGNDPLWERRSFEAGAVIFEEDSPSNELYLVLEGDVEISKRVGEDGARKKVLAVLGRGSIFGEGALLSDQPRSATATALKPLDVLVLSKDRFKSYVKEDPVRANFLVLGLVRVINQRLIWTNEELVTLYDVVEIVSAFKDDVEGMVERLTEKVKVATKAIRATIVLKSDVRAETGRVVREEGRLIVGIFDLSGARLGSMILEKESAADWRLEQEKVAEVIADHLGIALADHHFLQADKDRLKLKRESVQF